MVKMKFSAMGRDVVLRTDAHKRSPRCYFLGPMRLKRALAVLLLCAGAARAQSVDVGDGHLGDLSVDNPGTILNKALTLTSDVPAGSNLLTVGATLGWFPSDLLLVIRVRGGSSDGSETMQAGSAGDFFFTRISPPFGWRPVRKST